MDSCPRYRKNAFFFHKTIQSTWFFEQACSSPYLYCMQIFSKFKNFDDKGVPFSTFPKIRKVSDFARQQFDFWTIPSLITLCWNNAFCSNFAKRWDMPWCMPVQKFRFIWRSYAKKSHFFITVVSDPFQQCFFTSHSSVVINLHNLKLCTKMARISNFIRPKFQH